MPSDSEGDESLSVSINEPAGAGNLAVVDPQVLPGPGGNDAGANHQDDNHEPQPLQQQGGPSMLTLTDYVYDIGGRLVEIATAQGREEVAEFKRSGQRLGDVMVRLNTHSNGTGWVCVTQPSRCCGMKKLDIQALDPDLRTVNGHRDKDGDRYYVGWDGMTGRPSFCAGKHPHTGLHAVADLGDNWRGAVFRTDRPKFSSKIRLPHVTMMVEGRLSLVKKVSIQHMSVRDHFSSEDINTYLRSNSRRAENSIPLRPLGNANDARPPTLMALLDTLDPITSGDNSTFGNHYHRIPYMANLNIPAELIDLVKLGLSHLSSEFIPLNLAVSGTLTWARIHRDGDREVERLARDANKRNKSTVSSRKEVPRCSLSVFITYYPHFYRMHEQHKIALYMHPYRFAEMRYREDVDKHGSLALEDHLFNEHRIIQIYKDMAMGPDDWLPIVPASMTGSRIPEFADMRNFTRRRDLRDLALIPDVHSLGFPFYPTEFESPTREVLRLEALCTGYLEGTGYRQVEEPLQPKTCNKPRGMNNRLAAVFSAPYHRICKPLQPVRGVVELPRDEEGHRLPAGQGGLGIPNLESLREFDPMNASHVEQLNSLHLRVANERLKLTLAQAIEQGVQVGDLRTDPLGGLNWDGRSRFLGGVGAAPEIDIELNGDMPRRTRLSDHDTDLLRQVVTGLTLPNGRPREVAQALVGLLPDAGLNPVKNAAFRVMAQTWAEFHESITHLRSMASFTTELVAECEDSVSVCLDVQLYIPLMHLLAMDEQQDEPLSQQLGNGLRARGMHEVAMQVQGIAFTLSSFWDHRLDGEKPNIVVMKYPAQSGMIRQAATTVNSVDQLGWVGRLGTVLHHLDPTDRWYTSENIFENGDIDLGSGVEDTENGGPPSLRLNFGPVEGQQ